MDWNTILGDIISGAILLAIGMTGNLALPTLIAICSAALGKTQAVYYSMFFWVLCRRICKKEQI